jgi:UDP-2,3-diacylglucosamine pyrophosphatase LpxH
MTDFYKDVARRLDEVYNESSHQEGRELADLRLILFSDLHKGRHDSADDFEQCELTYLGALRHYWQDGFELLLVGDIEELWECSPSAVVHEYAGVLEQERPFAEASGPARYMRFAGNHDDLWYYPEQVERHLGPYINGKPVLDGGRLLIHDQGERLGELYIVHGHQGTWDSDRFAGLSALFVRFIWRPIQRLLNVKTSTPSTSFALRQAHELAMYAYAEARSGLVLIAGHTHHPVWEGLGLEQAMALAGEAGVMAEVDAAWMSEQVAGAVTLPGRVPCYFNTGCCSYSDGSITGIEIADGQIRLVRWDSPAQPARTQLFAASLRDVLAAVQ